jgi:hypothetical protein
VKTKSQLVKVASAVVVAALGFAASMASATGFNLGDATYYLNSNNGPGLDGLTAVGNIGIDNTRLLAVSEPLVINGNVQFANAVHVQGNYNNGGNVVINGAVGGDNLSLTHSVLNGRFFGGDTQDAAIVGKSIGPPTPDAGSTFVLLGIAFLGLGSVRHKLQIRKL